MTPTDAKIHSAKQRAHDSVDILYKHEIIARAIDFTFAAKNCRLCTFRFIANVVQIKEQQDICVQQQEY